MSEHTDRVDEMKTTPNHRVLTMRAVFVSTICLLAAVATVRADVIYVNIAFPSAKVFESGAFNFCHENVT